MTPDAIRRAIGHASAAELAEGLNAALDYMSGVGHSAPAIERSFHEIVAAVLTEPAQPTCTCDSPGGPIPHRPECELNHPHHPCDDRSCRYAVPAQAESRVWRVTAVPDGTDTDEIGTLHRERDGRWESWYDDDEGDDGDWYPSDWTGVAEMERYGYTLAEVTDRAGEA